MKNLGIKKMIGFILLHKVKLSVIVMIVVSLGVASGVINKKYSNSNDRSNVSRLEYDRDVMDRTLGDSVIRGTLDVVKEIEEYDENAKDLSGLPTVEYESGNPSNSSGGTASGGSSNSSSNSSQIAPNNPVVMDYSSFTGQNARILEGESFNPLEALSLSAKDKNGADIKHKIEIIENQVNIYKPGHYSVKARVKLSDGTLLTRQFNVEVVYQQLVVNVNSLTLAKKIVEKHETNVVNLDVYSSKAYVHPISVQVNNQSYTLNKDENDRYSFVIPGSEASGKIEYRVSSITMSDQTVITVNEKFNQIVKKAQPTVDNFMSEFRTEDEKMVTKFKLIDSDQAVLKGSYPKVIVYDMDNQEIGQLPAHKNQNNTLYYKISHNGQYTIKVLAELDLTGDGDVHIVELYSKQITISSIDRTSLTGKNVTIKEGTEFNAIKDLQLQAMDKDGLDITNQIEIEGDVDTKTPGKYVVKAQIINSEGVVLEKEFVVTVEAVKTEVEVTKFETSTTDFVVGSIINSTLELTLSKDYVELTKVVINDQSYKVERIGETNEYEIRDIQLTDQPGNYELNLTQLELSNGETLKVNHRIELNMLTAISTVLMDEQYPVATYSKDVDLFSHSSSTRNAQVTGSQNVSEMDTNTAKAEVSLSGIVRTGDGMAPAGRIEVTLPTSISFVVDQAGNVQLPSSLPVNNHSSVGIVLSIQGFTESQPQSGITVKNAVSDSDPRSTVALRISGNTGSPISLLHNGITTSPTVLTLGANSSGSLVVNGEAGKANATDVDSNGVSETFTITFSVKKQ